jgi:hypothetical protein|tara:strand:- start:274 stop:867 length:594 start_codon:yes stop_codon:yes gene_type:complete
MSFVSRAGDLFYAFRFLKLLVTPFSKTKAYALGIIDDKGKVLKRAKQRTKPDEKAAYTVFHRLVFNLKRLIGKVPGGRSVVARYGAALFLIREHTNMSDEKMMEMLEKALDIEIDPYDLTENTWYQDENSNLYPGNYILTEDIASPITGEVIALKNTRVVVEDLQAPIGRFQDINIYRVKHSKTNQELYVSNGDICR